MAVGSAASLERLGERLEDARALAAAGDFGRAQEGYRTLAEELDGLPAAVVDVRRLRIRTILGLALCRQELTGDLDAALALVDEAERHWGDDLADLGVTFAGQRALCLVRAGRPDDALRAFEAAEPRLAAASAEDRALLLLNRGVLHLERGSLTASARDLERAATEAADADIANLVFKARHNLAYLAYLVGDLPRALALMDRASEVPEVEQLAGSPIALLDRARVLAEAGLVEDADDLLLRALADLRGTDRAQDEGEAHLARARGALIDGDLALASAEAERARQRFATRDNPLWLRRARFTQLAVALEKLQRPSRDTPAGGTGERGASPPGTVAAASALADEIDGLARSAAAAGDASIATPAFSMLAEAALVAGEIERARSGLAASTPAPDDPMSVRLRWYRARAGLAVASGGDDVQRTVAAGLDELARAQSRLGSLDLRTAIAIHGHELAELGVADALGSGDPDTIHLAVERSHASSTRLAAVRADASEHELDLLARLRRADDALWHLDGRADPDRATSLRREIAALQQELRRHGWQRSGGGDAGELVALPAAREALGRVGAIAASFTRVGDDLYAVRIDERDVGVIPLGSASATTRLVERLRADLQAVALAGIPPGVMAVMRRSLEATLAELDARLVRPLEVDAAALVVVPHAELALVPWPLLAGRRGLATTTAPCLTECLRVGRRPSRPRSQEVVAFSGPGLRRAEAEATAVAAAWPHGTARTGAAATGAALKRALATAGVVHLAAHGTHQAASPLFSSLRLADGPVFAHELDSDPAARLVVLSACEVGSHTVRTGDEHLGLTAALLQAGVSTVLAGVARVDDGLAHDVMVDVHARVADGAAPAAALGTAVAHAWDRGHVAPFTSVGVGILPAT